MSSLSLVTCRKLFCYPPLATILAMTRTMLSAHRFLLRYWFSYACTANRVYVLVVLYIYMYIYRGACPPVFLLLGNILDFKGAEGSEKQKILTYD